MADDKEDDPIATMRGHIATMKKHLKSAGEGYDKANDMMDHIESTIGRIKGNPTPQRRPIAAGPDAAGNDRSSNAESRDWYDKED